MVSVLPRSERTDPDVRGASLAQIEAVYRSSFDRFLAVAATICRNGEDGREAVQEGFAQAIRSRESYRGDAPLDAWLWRVVINAAHSAARRPRPLAVRDLPDAAPQPADTDGMLALLEALPERQRTVLFMRYYADLDYRTIADVLEIGVGTVGSTLNAALAALRRGMARKVTE
jgi:RNA polymerase sigma factor (sigma-70 family)